MWQQNKNINDYQIEIIEKFKNYRPEPIYPTYPPYHKGMYLEDGFFKWFLENDICLDRYYIPVFWTTCYIQNIKIGLQDLLNTLDNTKKYFVVSQHDDAILEKLPSDTLHFNAGGNKGGIPIPLICSPIDIDLEKNEKDIFCSFVGSMTHPIRYLLFQVLKNNNKYRFDVKNWSDNVHEDDFRKFVDITRRSIFSLCPRGYGRTSFRLYECLQLESIPVYIYDDKWLPFENSIDWSKFSVSVHVSNIHRLDDILSSYSVNDIKEMTSSLRKYWIENFTMLSTFKKIEQIING